MTILGFTIAEVAALCAVLAAILGFLRYLWRRATRYEEPPKKIEIVSQTPADKPEEPRKTLRLNIPRVGRLVTGRDQDARELNDKLKTQSAVAIVKGHGGIGKTTLAKHYIEMFGDRYDGVLWLRAEDEAELVESLLALAPHLKLDGLDALNEKQRARALLDALSGLDEEWLLIFDNAPDEKSLAEWLPKGERIKVLVTSRHTTWPPRYEVFGPEVLAFEKETDPAPVVLMQEAGTRVDPAGARDLAEALGGLPLALVAAGGLIREQGGSFADYQTKLAQVLDEVPTGDYPDGVIGAVKLSYDVLSEDAKTVLDLFAWYASEGLDARLLTDVPGGNRVEGFEEDISERLLEFASSSERVAAALTEAVRRSLLTRNGDSFDMHRLTGEAIRALQKAEARDESVSKAAAAVLAAGYPSGVAPSIKAHWPDCARLTPHVLALERAGAPTITASHYLFNQASIYLRHMAFYGDAVRLAERSLELARARLLDSDREVAGGWSMLGAAYRQAGRLEDAVTAQAESLRLCEAHDHGAGDLATAYNNHASALRALGQKTGDRDLLKQALAQDGKALELRRETFGEESTEVALSLANLAASHAALGQMEAALESSEQALAIWREVLPEGDARLGSSLNTHGANLLEAGKPEDAEGLLLEALDLRRAAYGRDDHPNVKNTASWLVSCLLVLARAGDEAKRTEAKALCKDFGLDLGMIETQAEDFPDPS